MFSKVLVIAGLVAAFTLVGCSDPKNDAVVAPTVTAPELENFESQAGVQSGCKGSVPVVQRSQVAPYILTVAQPIKMVQNSANKNFHKYIYNARMGGCILFSKLAEIPAGDYSSEKAYASYNVCANKNSTDQGKLAYAFVKFDGAGNRDTIRVQCYKAVSEIQAEVDQDKKAEGEHVKTDRFAPNMQQLGKVVASRTGDVSIRVKAR